MGALRRRSLSFDGREPLSSGLQSKEQRSRESGHPMRLTFVVVCREPEARDERPGRLVAILVAKAVGCSRLAGVNDVGAFARLRGLRGDLTDSSSRLPIIGAPPTAQLSSIAV